MRMTPLNRLRYQAPLCETESKASWYFSCSQEQQKTKPAEPRRRLGLQQVAVSLLQSSQTISAAVSANQTGALQDSFGDSPQRRWQRWRQNSR